MAKRGMLVGLIVWLATAAWAGPSVLWQQKINGYADKPAAADLNGDHRLELLIGTDRGYMMALSGGNGNLLWELDTSGLESFLGNPLIGDVDLDGRAEVIFLGSKLGAAYCINGEDASVLWQKAGLGGGVTGSAALAAINAGESMSVVYVERDNLRCLNALDGELRWSWPVPGTSDGSVTIADLDGQLGKEILVGTNDGKLLCLSAGPAGPAIKWSTDVRGRTVKPAMIADADRDGRLEIYLPGNAGITRLDSNGNIQWRWSPKAKGVSSSCAIYDVTGDGKPEIAVSGSDGSLYAVSTAGKTVWSYPIVSDKMFIPASTPAIADFSGDRAGDLIVVSPQSSDPKVHAVNGKTGKALWTWPMPWFSQGCPLIADLDSDGMIDVVYPVLQGKGLLVCLKLNARSAGGWLKYGGDLGNTGFWPAAAEDSASLVVGRSPIEVQPVTVDWESKLAPAPERLPGGPAGGVGRPLTDIAVSLNGNWLLLDPAPFIANSSVLVPLRGIFEAMRSEVKYEPATKVITAVRGDTEVVLKLGSTAATVSGQPVALTAPATSINGSTFVPLRFIAESFQAKVKWESSERNVVITDPSLASGEDG